jgi:hypothetical protein
MDQVNRSQNGKDSLLALDEIKTGGTGRVTPARTLLHGSVQRPFDLRRSATPPPLRVFWT